MRFLLAQGCAARRLQRDITGHDLLRNRLLHTVIAEGYYYARAISAATHFAWSIGVRSVGRLRVGYHQ